MRTSCISPLGVCLLEGRAPTRRETRLHGVDVIHIFSCRQGHYQRETRQPSAGGDIHYQLTNLFNLLDLQASPRCYCYYLLSVLHMPDMPCRQGRQPDGPASVSGHSGGDNNTIQFLDLQGTVFVRSTIHMCIE